MSEQVKPSVDVLLRDRIAQAIYQTPPVWDQWPWGDLTDDARQVFLEQAEAVIAALGLEQEWISHPAEGTQSIRYVTEWENDDRQPA